MMAFDVLFPDVAKNECRTIRPINDGCGSFVTAENPAKVPYLTTRRRGFGIGSGTSPSA